MITVDKSKIPNLAEREEVERIFLTFVAAEEAFNALNELANDTLDEKYEPLFDALDLRCKEAHREVSKKFEQERDELRNQRAAERGTSEYRAAELAEKAARDAYYAHPLTVDTGHDDKLQRCALSGVALLSDDETLDDEETGEKILRCLLLPARPVENEETEEAA